ncbi:hypothetical protein [Rhizobium sp. P44RR-XXIV]|uniref:hypothetical protein n=1 Tax=Rhizobium sp. P44RR-XXIV TaxID=1921145 RepID=UPI000985E23D|nr:hypothetical protein [Rhizobium sp. P44RR-XXIV]TIX88607.1 hypothetical protein BSK43_018185 [Rhizobium sp. P44RR-XXIV]
MSEMFQGFLACVGAALFFASMLAAVRSIVRRPAFPYAEEEGGAPEGDQAHFRVAEDHAIRAGEPTCSTKRR